MKLYLDTANSDFVISIFDNNFKEVESIKLLNYQKKVNLIPEKTKEILKLTNTKITDYDCFYINIGPGFFTGVRISLVYLRTIALIYNIKIKTISSMQILARQNPAKTEFAINANGGKYYSYKRTKELFNINQVTLEKGELNSYDAIDHDLFIKNFKYFESDFKDYKDLMDIEPYYIKLPQIGAKK
ncbi:tRNA (adenosine(37)-N6)-threonylcarbamoyltransferase complex dimerization subunit type 1 TsaB [Mycoplasma sp. Mirounga ES2805-ORL]|uniref:tRNA (adenosine(37)-N6)-threonylcarbamoyltransferase complex dimerization subunit type 1 TsaB n=1 Tax=Mycoplasma sp. Mirounga ES2805-ORL TaxID=754514 RepID=UPI00197BEEAD|nr:tRNA (adenosine(37)-N6)-threonylcarbamoyltransferase complex dimerization subunit type 1 TsaB [Mycoplasma sp. Mirounga ES2805-ORL]QSF13775.1 tRNA (adenosine(37)-N6)-threonylcarbamoyltransferase complex dimerization subunit type 1 TsaB [Mycoplasma sp. Mirounga ES2805-ORL]